MIGLSQLYGRSVDRSWSEEFSLKNFGIGLSGAEGGTKASDEDSYNPFV